MHASNENIQPGRLLVLDDDADVGATIVAMGRRLGLDCQATTGREAFMAALLTWQPTHIVLDLIMPEADGVEILTELAARGASEVIVLTSGAAPRVLEAAERLGLEHGLNIAGVLNKPFSFSALGALIGQVPSRAPEYAPVVGPDPEITRAQLLQALEQRQFSLVYQPKVSCRDGRLVGFEALVRWHHPDHGMLMPARFIALAEQLGLIDEVTDLLLEEGLDWLARTAPDSHLTLAFNFAAITLTRLPLVDRIARLCAERDLSPARIVVEVTETGAMGDPVRSLDVLTRLRLKGVGLSIDDFGVGYSSLSQLARLPYSELKIDRTFVAGAAHSAEARNIISAIIGLAQSLDLGTVAEGVEDLAAFHFLKTAGCDVAQGYFIGRPMPADAAVAWMSQPAA